MTSTTPTTQSPSLRPAVGAALALALSIGTLACSSKSNLPPAEQTGAELFANYCASCHGSDGKGSFLNLGPSYEGIAQHWDGEKLLEYIDDPQAYAAKHERLGKRDMTAIPSEVTPDARQRLVDHALSLMD